VWTLCLDSAVMTVLVQTANDPMTHTHMHAHTHARSHTPTHRDQTSAGTLSGEAIFAEITVTSGINPKCQRQFNKRRAARYVARANIWLGCNPQGRKPSSDF